MAKCRNTIVDIVERRALGANEQRISRFGTGGGVIAVSHFFFYIVVRAISVSVRVLSGKNDNQYNNYGNDDSESDRANNEPFFWIVFTKG